MEEPISFTSWLICNILLTYRDVEQETTAASSAKIKEVFERERAALNALLVRE